MQRHCAGILGKAVRVVGILLLAGCQVQAPPSADVASAKPPAAKDSQADAPSSDTPETAAPKAAQSTATPGEPAPAGASTPADSLASSALPTPAAKPTASAAPVADAKSGAASVPALETPTENGLNWLSREELEQGWIRLFDGQTLFGWAPTSDLNWSISEGVISADSGTPGLLCTTSRFADYELRCDYRLAAGGNSGIFLRTVKTPKDPGVDCYELNMCDTHPQFGTASLVKRAKPAETVTGDGAWHTFHVRVEGPRVTVQFDGKPVLDYTDASENPLTTGHIGLQMNGGKVEFRNVYLKPLGGQPLFDGKSLTGWRVVPGSESEFTVRDETIHVRSGRGFLETEQTAGNFVLQFEAITNGDKLNSGVFFRAMPGTAQAPSHGYEFQIQSGIKGGDRNQPEDFGTGAIFRRIAARRVISNDRQWFTATLVADGPHLTTWVDGVQVVDWTDERKPNDNPREGLRVKPGHFSLQGHDPTTDLAFRNLRLVKTPD